MRCSKACSGLASPITSSSTGRTLLRQLFRREAEAPHAFMTAEHGQLQEQLAEGHIEFATLEQLLRPAIALIAQQGTDIADLDAGLRGAAPAARTQNCRAQKARRIRVELSRPVLVQGLDEAAHFLGALARGEAGEQDVFAAMFDEGRNTRRFQVVFIDEALEDAAGDDGGHAFRDRHRQGAALCHRIGQKNEGRLPGYA